jgi:hypothetical protein
MMQAPLPDCRRACDLPISDLQQPQWSIASARGSHTDQIRTTASADGNTVSPIANAPCRSLLGQGISCKLRQRTIAEQSAQAIIFRQQERTLAVRIYHE